MTALPLALLGLIWLVLLLSGAPSPTLRPPGAGRSEHARPAVSHPRHVEASPAILSKAGGETLAHTVRPWASHGPGRLLPATRDDRVIPLPGDTARPQPSPRMAQLNGSGFALRC